MALPDFTCRYIRLISSHYLPLSQVYVFSPPLVRIFFSFEVLQAPTVLMKSNYSIFKDSLDLGFFLCKILRDRIHDFTRTRPGFLSRWQLVLPISFQSSDLIILGTWSLFDDHRREPIGKYLVLSGGCSFSLDGMVRTLDSLFTPTHFLLAGDFKSPGQLLTACLLALVPTVGGQI